MIAKSRLKEIILSNEEFIQAKRDNSLQRGVHPNSDKEDSEKGRDPSAAEPK